MHKSSHALVSRAASVPILSFLLPSVATVGPASRQAVKMSESVLSISRPSPAHVQRRCLAKTRDGSKGGGFGTSERGPGLEDRAGRGRSARSARVESAAQRSSRPRSATGNRGTSKSIDTGPGQSRFNEASNASKTRTASSDGGQQKPDRAYLTERAGTFAPHGQAFAHPVFHPTRPPTPERSPPNSDSEGRVSQNDLVKALESNDTSSALHCARVLPRGMVLEVTKPEDLLKLLTAAAQQRFGFDHLIALTCAHPAATPIDILKAHNVAINGHARRGDGHRLHYYLRQLRSHGIQPDVATHDSIVLLHCVQGRMDLAERVLERMRNPKPAESTYSVIIRGYARCGDFEAVRVWSDKLVASGLTNGVLPVQLYATFISTYGFRGRLADARNAFAEAQARGVVNVALVAAWISVLGRSERVAEAEGVFREWKELSRTQRNAAGERSSQVKETPEAWTALIRARSSHPTRSKELWDEMLEEGVIPDSFAVYALVEHFVNVVTLKRSSDFAAARALVDRVLRLAHDMKQKYPEVVLDYFTFSPAFAWLVPPPPKTVERDMQSDTQAPSEFPVQQSAEVTETDMESVSTETVGLRRIQPTKAILSLVDSLSSSLSAIHPRFRSSPALMNSLAWRFAQSGDPRTAWVWVTKARELGNRSNAATYEEIIRAFLSLSPSKGGLSSVISLIQEMRRAGIQIADIELSQELLGKFLESGMVEDAVETLLQTEWKTHDTNGGAPEGTLPDALLPHLNHLLTLIPEHAASDPSRALRLITLLAPHIRHPDPCYPTVMDALSQAGQGFEAVRLWMQMRGRNIRPSRWSAEALMRAVRTESEIDIARAFVVEVREGKWATGADPIVWDLGLAQLYLQALGTCGTVEETIRVLLDIHDWASLTEEVYMSTVDHMRRHGRITDAREIEDFLEECAPEAIPMHASH